MDALYYILLYGEYVIIGYVAAINSIYLLLMALGFFAIREHRQGLAPFQRDLLATSPLAPTISILAPAFNEAATIRDSVRAMLTLEYPKLEIIVINDGSNDETLPLLIDEFRLYRSSRFFREYLPCEEIKGVYESRDPVPLVVVDKENGGKADALNAGINVARGELFSAVDSDSLLEPHALVYVIEPFLSNPKVVATGGTVRVANGCEVKHGRVIEVRCPRSLLVRFQILEYLRAFLGGRVALSLLNCLLIISGAFGVFRRSSVVASGGFNKATVGEDMELIVRLHRLYREAKSDYRIVFVPDPVCWTEVPDTLKILQRQRNRWQRGTIESLKTHKRMLFNPTYGAIGMLATPYYTLFEALGPVVELMGYVLVLVGLLSGWFSTPLVALFFVVSILFGVLLSLTAVVLEEFTLRHYTSLKDLRRLLVAAILENFGYRQILLIWRTKGLVDAVLGKQGWGDMERRGFAPS